jgi:hypothetical protein
LTDEELKQPWMRDAASAVALLILDMQGTPIESGAMSHAVHGLAIKAARV